jgi:hypothetical protein
MLLKGEAPIVCISLAKGATNIIVIRSVLLNVFSSHFYATLTKGLSGKVTQNGLPDFVLPVLREPITNKDKVVNNKLLNL